MATSPETAAERPAWFVGAAFGGTDDQTDRFVDEDIWENGYQDRYLVLVREVRVGDRIAIKATYTRKYDLPFDNRGRTVSVMAIKAVGTVTHNLGDGRHLAVDWTPVDPHREWYFYTCRRTVWKVLPNNYAAKNLIAFTFEDEVQDIDEFRSRPLWQARFGDDPVTDGRFSWVSFYSTFADKLRQYRYNRPALLTAIDELPSQYPTSLVDRFADGTSGLMRDICPFTTIGIFNRNMKFTNRKGIARHLANALGMEELATQSLQSLDGISILNNQNSWFFPFEHLRDDAHIDTLWQVFSDALTYADNSDETNRAALVKSFNNAVSLKQVGRKLSIGLYWIRPHAYVGLDRFNRDYIKGSMGLAVPGGKPDGETYLDLCEALQLMFADENQRVHSFPELSLAAWTRPPPNIDIAPDEPEMIKPSTDTRAPKTDSGSLYTVDDIVDEGCFLEQARLEAILERWRIKKNLILQGPPGTGKTWLAKKLAFALVGTRSRSRVRPMQFHPNLSYEDFVRGWRPSGGTDGRLELVDGPFLKAVEDANKAPDRSYVVVIEEINRGNPAQIFGEMLTLLEADKRTPAEALALSYPRSEDERVHIPRNLYVVGTMNIADRSLALVDLALRRRFAFVDLEPVFGARWRSWVSEQCGPDEEFLAEVERRLTALNETISSDKSLGRQFRVGHSLVTPSGGTPVTDQIQWFIHVVETEIGPLLDEYWFDELDIARSAKDDLLRGLSS